MEGELDFEGERRMHFKLRMSAIAAAVALLVVLDPSAALASGSGGAWTNGPTIGAGASDSGTGEGGDGGGCSYTPLSPADSAIADQMAAEGLLHSHGAGQGAWYRVVCGDDEGRLVWIGAAVDPVELAQRALDEAAVPLPGIHLNPPTNSEQVVNLETWMWVDGWAPVTASATAGVVTVTVTATPTRVDWSMGDGNSVTCGGPGIPYDTSGSPDEQHTDCGYTYRHSSADQLGGAYVVEATSIWHVTWTATGIAGAGGDLGFINRTSAIPVRVAEIQAVNR
jgi:hypothetical protein